MERSIKIKWEQIFVAVFAIVFCILFVNRLGYGVETSDEAYYCVTGYRMLKGNVPFADMWEPTAGSAYIMAPFLWIRSLVIKDGEGIQLYLRVCYGILNLLSAWAIYAYTQKDIKKEYAFLLGLVFLFNAPFRIYNFSYNNLAYTFTAISICMALKGRTDQKKRFLYLAGVAMALAVLAYPTMLYCCVVLAVVIVAGNPPIKGIRSLLMYAAGGLTVAVPVLCHVLLHTGINGLLANLQSILSSDLTPELSARRTIYIIVRAVLYLLTQFWECKEWFLVYGVVFCSTLSVKKTRPMSTWLILGYPLICFYLSVTRKLTYFSMMLAMAAPMAIFLSADKKGMLKKVTFEWGLSLVTYFVVAISSGGGAAQAAEGLILATVVSVKLIIESLKENMEIRYDRIVAYVLLVSMILGEISIFYHGMYREAPYQRLTAKIESGAYKGLYTTPERKEHILDLESVLSQVEDPGETVMVLYHSCFAYLMLDMIPKIPTSWGCVDYQAYGFDNQDLFMNYLADVNNVPDNIIILDIPDKYDVADQAVERFEPYYPELNQFIQNNYMLAGVYEEGESGVVMKYERKQKLQ